MLAPSVSEIAQRRSIDAQIASLRLTSRLPIVIGDWSLLERLRIELKDTSLEGSKFSLPIKAHGTDFQSKVWAALLQIPYGQTRSYGELAEAAGLTWASGRLVPQMA
ncbi:hypothetical protein MASR2M48_04660 [Spirochaetota bacterium]